VHRYSSLFLVEIELWLPKTVRKDDGQAAIHALSSTKVSAMSAAVEDITMNRFWLALVSTLLASAASAEVPLFAARCPTGITVDTGRGGVVYINGKQGEVIERPDGQISARSHGIWVDITPQGYDEPLVTYTGKDKSTGRCEILSFNPGSAPAEGQRESSSERAGQGQFDASGNIPCAQYQGQPMSQCRFEVTREGGGSATVIVTLPDGRKRAIFFEKGNALGADLSQADGDMSFRATKEADLYMIRAGKERYEIPEAVIFGG